jgi:hypothetical protein
MTLIIWGTVIRHCEERSDEAIQNFFSDSGLLQSVIINTQFRTETKSEMMLRSCPQINFTLVGIIYYVNYPKMSISNIPYISLLNIQKNKDNNFKNVKVNSEQFPVSFQCDSNIISAICTFDIYFI